MSNIGSGLLLGGSSGMIAVGAGWSDQVGWIVIIIGLVIGCICPIYGQK